MSVSVPSGQYPPHISTALHKHQTREVTRKRKSTPTIESNNLASKRVRNNAAGRPQLSTRDHRYPASIPYASSEELRRPNTGSPTSCLSGPDDRNVHFQLPTVVGLLTPTLGHESPSIHALGLAAAIGPLLQSIYRLPGCHFGRGAIHTPIYKRL